ncbi:alpha/beta fold hydrolase [Paenibacillus sp. BC26]|uniref:alpha/beta fold hydrolase n=1 Tax=Paenibacillus sp. BC26 TaxID=1881032 RepID=UPI0008DF6377|nr:alpha/beta hydrolase [Paenibacillus sp. BC26]SFT26555.1 Pimeloyl-ACP methyl ester carboxylesterase [Paenibacillus sp. BC26]
MTKKKDYYTLHSAVSKDGTVIGYRQSGRGPGLVIIHGAFVSGHEYEKLAQELSDTFTVYVVDRRGRLYSGPQGMQYSIEKECEDALAVLQATGAPYVFGHSYGGLIALELARTTTLPAVIKLAAYEPAISVDGEFPSGWMPDYKRQMEKGQDLDAFVTFLKGVGTSERMVKLPRWLIKLMLLPSLLFREGRKLREKLPTLIKEMDEVFRLDSTVRNYSAIRIETLILAGGNSPAFLLKGAGAAAAVIPNASYSVMEGLGHNAPDLFNQKEIAQRLKRYFAGERAANEQKNLGQLAVKGAAGDRGSSG